jgi:transposase InsO family protein
MSTQKKVELISSVKDEHGLAPALRALELPRATWYYHPRSRRPDIPYEEKYAHIRPILEDVLREHPSYGIPRITPELADRYGRWINHKVIQELLHLWDLSLLRKAKKPRPGIIRQAILAAGDKANLVKGMTHIGVFAVSYTDFTEIRYANGYRKAHLMPIIGHACKMSYGWALGESADSELALEAWSMAKRTFARLGISCEGMIVHQDQDSVYTGHMWTGQLLLRDKVRLSYALDGARDNTEMESFNSHFKQEGNSLFLDAGDIEELKIVVSRQMRYYNTKRRHSSLGYVSPMTYIDSILLDGKEGN